jgi:hypothetical protein
MPVVFFGTKSMTFNEKADDPNAPALTQSRCPHCHNVTTFAPKRVMRFIHIFWIPLIPVSGFKQVYECQGCKAKFVRNEE